jgi:hypothetical protein
LAKKAADKRRKELEKQRLDQKRSGMSMGSGINEFSKKFLKLKILVTAVVEAQVTINLVIHQNLLLNREGILLVFSGVFLTHSERLLKMLFLHFLRECNWEKEKERLLIIRK